MKLAIPAALALAVVALTTAPASAQRYRNTNIHTPYGTFTQAEMANAGQDPSTAFQIRQQQQAMQMQQQMMKQQQQYMQQQKQQADFLKKNPDAAKALINAYTPKTAPKKMTRADREKAKRESGEVARTTPADPVAAATAKAKADTTKAATAKADTPGDDASAATESKPATATTTSKPSLATSRKPK